VGVGSSFGSPAESTGGDDVSRVASPSSLISTLFSQQTSGVNSPSLFLPSSPLSAEEQPWYYYLLSALELIKARTTFQNLQNNDRLIFYTWMIDIAREKAKERDNEKMCSKEGGVSSQGGDVPRLNRILSAFPSSYPNMGDYSLFLFNIYQNSSHLPLVFKTSSPSSTPPITYREVVKSSSISSTTVSILNAFRDSGVPVMIGRVVFPSSLISLLPSSLLNIASRFSNTSLESTGTSDVTALPFLVAYTSTFNFPFMIIVLLQRAFVLHYKVFNRSSLFDAVPLYGSISETNTSFSFSSFLKSFTNNLERISQNKSVFNGFSRMRMYISSLISQEYTHIKSIRIRTNTSSQKDENQERDGDEDGVDGNVWVEMNGLDYSNVELFNTFYGLECIFEGMCKMREGIRKKKLKGGKEWKGCVEHFYSYPDDNFGDDDDEIISDDYFDSVEDFGKYMSKTDLQPKSYSYLTMGGADFDSLNYQYSFLKSSPSMSLPIPPPLYNLYSLPFFTSSSTPNLILPYPSSSPLSMKQSGSPTPSAPARACITPALISSLYSFISNTTGRWNSLVVGAVLEKKKLMQKQGRIGIVLIF
jgi:hypothetical protein